MKATFVDTVYWLALLVEEDDYHQRAVEWSQVVSTPLLTTEAILFEVGDALTDPAVRSLAGQFLACAWQDPSLTVVRTDAELYRATLELFRDRQDKRWGLTDCLSFVVMHREGVTDALTADDHFRQAGFRPLLLEATDT